MTAFHHKYCICQTFSDTVLAPLGPLRPHSLHLLLVKCTLSQHFSPLLYIYIKPNVDHYTKKLFCNSPTRVDCTVSIDRHLSGGRSNRGEMWRRRGTKCWNKTRVRGVTGGGGGGEHTNDLSVSGACLSRSWETVSSSREVAVLAPT